MYISIVDIWVPWDAKAVMAIHGYRWMCEFPGAPGGYHGIPGICMEIHGYLDSLKSWVGTIGFQRCPWASMDIHGCQWISGLLEIPRGRGHGVAKICMHIWAHWYPSGFNGIQGISIDIQRYLCSLGSERKSWISGCSGIGGLPLDGRDIHGYPWISGFRGIPRGLGSRVAGATESEGRDAHEWMNVIPTLSLCTI